MRVIVGLGNPGKQYAGTRHNIGYAVVEYMATAPAFGPFRPQFHGVVAEGINNNDKLLLLKPETYMNLSGRSVRALLDFYKLPVEDLLIVCDDFNLPLGKLRVRKDGSHGGQNGLRNIQEQLGTDAYPRLRIGVGEPNPGEAVDFVLSRFKPGEKAAVEKAVADAATGALLWATNGIEACMNAVNGGPPKPRKPVAPRPKEAGSNEGAPPREPQ
jgi:PTH1 family peptidyl-tRNA hydrolase